MHVWAEIETLLCATQKRNTIMANSIVITAVICYSTLLYIMDYYGIFIVYYDILLYIYILLLKSSLSLWHILAGSQFTGITQYNWVGTTLIQGLQGCLKTAQRSHNSPIANTFCSAVQAPAKFERKVSNLSDAAFGWLCTSYSREIRNSLMQL